MSDFSVNPFPKIYAYRSQKNAASVIASLHSEYGVKVLFSIHSSPDKSNSDHSLCSIYQGGLGMSDKDYYIDADKADKRAKYVEYIAKLFELLGQSGVSPYASIGTEGYIAAAKAVLSFETYLASSHLSRTQSRDPALTFNKMEVS